MTHLQKGNKNNESKHKTKEKGEWVGKVSWNPLKRRYMKRERKKKGEKNEEEEEEMKWAYQVKEGRR